MWPFLFIAFPNYLLVANLKYESFNFTDVLRKSVEFDSVKGETEVALYAAPESRFKVSFPLVSEIENAPGCALKVCLRMPLAIYIRTQKNVHLRQYFSCTCIALFGALIN